METSDKGGYSQDRNRCMPDSQMPHIAECALLSSRTGGAQDFLETPQYLEEQWL